MTMIQRMFLVSATALAVAAISTDARADSTRERYPASACQAVDATSRQDITYGSNGDLFNSGSVSRAVVCPAPIYYQMNAGHSVVVNIRAKQSTTCALRFTTTDGTLFFTTTQTATTPSLRFDATALGFFSANVRCAVPPQGRIVSYDVQRDGF